MRLRPTRSTRTDPLLPSATLFRSRVSLGLVRKDAVKLAAMSHGAWFRKRSDVAEALEAAMDEATDQGMALSLPKVREGDPVTLQQARLLAQIGRAHV